VELAPAARGLARVELAPVVLEAAAVALVVAAEPEAAVPAALPEAESSPGRSRISHDLPHVPGWGVPRRSFCAQLAIVGGQA